jgi:serine/threonine-protein kinase
MSARGLSLATRMFLSTALILVLALGAALAVTTILGERIAARAARDRVAASSSLQTSFEQQRVQQLMMTARMMASEPEFKAYIADALAIADRGSILDQLEERAGDLGYDLAMVVRPDGRLVARTDQPEQVGADLSQRALIARAREDFEAAGIWQEPTGLFEAVAVPMAIGDGLLGYLALGYKITDVRALDVKRGTGSDVLFLTAPDARLVGSTLTPPEADRLLTELRRRGDLLARVGRQEGQAEMVDLELDGARWTAQLAPLADAARQPVGVLVSLASLDRELAGFRRIRQVLLLTGLAALAAVVAVSWAVARRVLGPVRRLVEATAAARRGEYDVRAPAGGSGEVVELVQEINGLLGDLREKRDMAEYVQKLSRSMPEPTAVSTQAMPVVRPEVSKATLVGIELRRYVSPRPGSDAASTLERLSRDLRRIAMAVTGRGGKIQSVTGHRVLASFTGPGRSDHALGAASEISAAVAARENVFDDAAPPAVAMAAGDVVTGGVSWGDRSAVSVLGLPVQQLDGLLRESSPGEILLSPAVHTDLQPTLKMAGIELAPQRGLLSTHPLYLLPAEEAARVSGVDAARVTAGYESAAASGSRQTLSGIGPGTLLGSRFEILAVLGAGGMGMVFKARDRELDDVVALKMLKSEVSGDRALVERLKSELKLARRITHPNVLRTFDFGEIEGVPFISMEYVRGLTLRDLLEQSGRLPYSAGLRLGRQLLSGLAAAHSLAIIHRDIKPENIILDATGSAKLMDFGLARPVTRAEAGQNQAGVIVGTPHYLAPEQLQGLDPDTRSDVYACGVVLYEIFTGALPFGGENPMAILLEHLKNPPADPKIYWPEIPPALERILMRCLEKEPAARYSGAEPLLSELEELKA